MGILLWEHFYQETRAERDIFTVPLGIEGGDLGSYVRSNTLIKRGNGLIEKK